MADDVLHSIQRIPRGLAELLGLKTGGTHPTALHREVGPVVDTLQMYARTLKQSQFAVNAAAAVGGVATVTVPTGQFWVLLHCFARVAQPAAVTALAASLNVDDSVVAYGESQSFGNGFIFCVPFVPPYPWILEPGTDILVRINALAGAASVNLSVNAVVGVIG